VLVVGARGGTDFVLPAGNSKFEKLDQTQINETSDHIQLIKVGVLDPISSTHISCKPYKKLKH